MSIFQNLQSSHEALLQRQQANEPILNEVKAYIEQVRAASSQVGAPRERDQLRANLRYWAGYVFDQEKVYPNIDLAPGPTITSPSRLLPISIAVGGVLGLIGVLMCALLGGSLFFRGPLPTTTVTATAVGFKPTSSATHTPLIPTATLTPTDTLTPVPSPTINPAGIVVQLTNPQEGQAVNPLVTLSGIYSNLQPGWSIHALLQPLSGGGRYFPLPDFFIVPTGVTSGDWSLAATLGQGAELERPEQYNLRLIVAIDDLGRKALQDAEKTGFEQIPAGLIPFPQVITLSRGAYYAIDETRVLYTSVGENGTLELFAARLDGSDIRQITNTHRISEADASLSPSGRQIAFVGQEIDSSGNEVLSLWLMDSDGQNPIVLAREPGANYERPRWSPDGSYLAYSARVTDEEGTGIRLFIFDLSTKDSRKLTTGLLAPRFPSWMPDGKSLVFSAFSSSGTAQDLFQIDIASRQVTPLLETTTAEETQPTVSPDGQKIAYVGYPNQDPSSNRDIFVLDLATGESKRLTTGSALDWFPAWSPDGHIYFESWRDGTYIWAMDVDGANQHQILHGEPTSAGPYVGLMVAFLPLSP
jgi:hypothetical protein